MMTDTVYTKSNAGLLQQGIDATNTNRKHNSTGLHLHHILLIYRK